MFQSKVGKGLKPSPLFIPVTVERLTLFGASQLIQLKVLRAPKMKFGNQKLKNMAVNVRTKNLSLDIVRTFLNGPMTEGLEGSWKELFKAMVTREVGQTQ